MFTNRDIADYYNQTLNHYQKWWQLNEVQAVHYGYWDKDTKNFKEALLKLNTVMAQLAEIKRGDRLLDAGCGVGGSLFYLAEKQGIKGVGVTLSERQYAFANKLKATHAVGAEVAFYIEDYCHTPFANASFDVIWAIESITSTPDKKLFAQEAFRLLRPGGKLIVADYYRLHKPDPRLLLEKWRKTWSMAPFLTDEKFTHQITHAGFRLLKKQNITKNILPTARRMFYTSVAGALPSIVYNHTHTTSRFAKTHYLSGIYQYQSLKKKLWEYKLHLFEKPSVR